MKTRTTTFLLRIWGVEKETKNLFETQFLVTMPFAFFCELDDSYEKLTHVLKTDPNLLAVPRYIINLNDPVNHPQIEVQDGELVLNLSFARFVLACSNMPDGTVKRTFALHGELSHCGKHYTYQSESVDYAIIRLQAQPGDNNAKTR